MVKVERFKSAEGGRGHEMASRMGEWKEEEGQPTSADFHEIKRNNL